MNFSAGKVVTSGTGEPVPYEVRCKIQQRTYVTLGTHGFVRALEPGNKTLCHNRATRGTYGFIRTLDTGLPQ